MSDGFNMTQFLIQQLSGDLDEKLATVLIEERRGNRKIKNSEHAEFLQDRKEEKVSAAKERGDSPDEIKALAKSYDRRIQNFGNG